MSRSLSTLSYSGQPAKRSYPEATTIDCCRGSRSCTGCLCDECTLFLRNLCTISLWFIGHIAVR
uniref:Uncharacterized protein n=1 Tax=Arundo donax TaxID=35708 RepID=A0A0A9EW14_ARUDO